MSEALELDGGEVIRRLLAAEGVDYVFGVAAGKFTGFMKALAVSPGIRYVGTRHEAAAAHMAAGHFAACGRIAVAIAEAGPGSGNLVAGVASAYANHLPLLVLTSNNNRYAIAPDRGALMGIDARALFAPITKFSETVHDARRLPEMLRTAFRHALSGSPGPVHLNLPADILGGRWRYAASEFDWCPEEYRPVHRLPPAPAALAAARELLLAAERPLIVAGGGVIASDASGECAQLAERLGAPVTVTQMGLGAFASDHPGFIGQGGCIGGPAIETALAEADVILAVGCRFSSWLWNEDGMVGGAGARIIQINSEPTHLGRNARLAVGLCADARLSLRQLLDTLPADPERAAPRAWRRRLVAEYHAYLDELGRLGGEDGAMHPAELARSIAAALPAGALVVYDGAHTSFWSNDLTPVRTPRSRFHDAAMGQLGFGLPFAAAVQLARPGEPVFNITGDGSFGFSLTELDTLRRYGLPVITLIHNNAAWGVIAAAQERQGFALGVELEDVDYAAIARSFQCHGEVVEHPEQVEAALARARASGRPAVLDCRTRFVSHPRFAAFVRMQRIGERLDG